MNREELFVKILNETQARIRNLLHLCQCVHIYIDIHYINIIMFPYRWAVAWWGWAEGSPP